MPTDVRRHRRLESARERVIQEATTLLIERGLANLTLSELARRLDTSAGHLSYYFGSKDGLLLELLAWNEAELAELRAGILASPEPALDRIRRYCELYLPRTAGDPRWLVWAELWPRVPREPVLKESQNAYDARWSADLVGLLEELQVDDAPTVARRVLALLDGLSIALLTGEDDMTREVAWTHVRALLP